MSTASAFGIVGTAGHVDHGKTTLVRALTGVDTDRLPEEKRRGISIALGFAELGLPGGRSAGLVDVPGHERFVKTMVAGAAGIDACLLVVAADEGVMPQTREHLAIARLLGCRRGVVALSKADLVDEAWMQLVREDVARLLEDAGLAGWPLIPVSAARGDGLDPLRAAIATALEGAQAHADRGAARLPVDRVFSVAGFGTVVTGTLTSGRIELDGRLDLVPPGRAVRVRGLQVHGRPVREARAGQRVACNLSGVERQEVQRGQVLASPGVLRGQLVLTVRLHAMFPQAATRGPGAGRTEPRLAHGQRLHVHIGTAEAVARLALLEGDALAEGASAFATLRLDRPLAAARGDRFIVRSYSPVTTVGGGTVIEVGRHPRRRDLRELERLAVLERGDPSELLVAAVEEAGVLTLADGARRAGLPDAEAVAAAGGPLAQGRLLPLADLVTAEALPMTLPLSTPSRWRALSREAEVALLEHHAAYPLRDGMPREELRRAVLGQLEPRLAAAALDRLARDGVLELQGEHAAAPGWAPRLPPAWEEPARAFAAAVASAGFTPPAAEEALAAAGFAGPAGERAELLAHLEARGQVVRVAEFCFTPAAIDEASRRVREFLAAHRTMTVADLRDLLGVTRKHAVPIAEHLDGARVTRRLGDARTLA